LKYDFWKSSNKQHSVLSYSFADTRRHSHSYSFADTRKNRMSAITFNVTFSVKDILRDPRIRKALRDREDAHLKNIDWLDEDLAEKRHLENIAWLDEDLTEKRHLENIAWLDEDLTEKRHLENIQLLDEDLAEKYQMKKDERRGGYDEQKCDARIWLDGLDNVQCSFNKKGGCFCKRHQNLSDKNSGVWWLGKINKPRPENPYGPPHLPEMRNGKRTHVRIHKWINSKP